MSLLEFLGASKSRLLSLIAPSTTVRANVWLVFGNEAHDMDSQSSSILMAYFLHRRHQRLSSSDPNIVAGEAPIFCPIMNCSRLESTLRRDNIKLLNHIGLDPIYIDEIPFNKFFQRPNRDVDLKVALVDHNDVSPRQPFLVQFVRFIIDHHVEVDTWRDADPAIVEKTISTDARSCCTLLFEKILNEDPEMLEDEDVRQMLLMTILMDSAGLSDALPRDKTAFEKLTEGKSSKENAIITSEYNSLVEARFDLEGMTPMEIVKKDLKYAVDKKNRYIFCVSSVKVKASGLGLKDLDGRGSFMNSLVEAMNEKMQGSDHHEVLTAFFIITKKSGPYKRLLAAVRSDGMIDGEAIMTTIDEFLRKGMSFAGRSITGRREKKNDIFHTSTLPEDMKDNFVFSVFELDSPVSRKQVLPFLIESLSHDIEKKPAAVAEGRFTICSIE